ncbi:RelA/SpoT family protein [Nanoarchaeota archaeon]
MTEQIIESKYENELNSLVNNVKDYSPRADEELIKKAFGFALTAHKDQKRESGEEYITHPLEVAKILTELKVDSATMAAALLHDVLEDSKFDSKDLEKRFGKEVSELVKGVTKMEAIRFKDREEYTAENIRKVVLAMAKDVRVILIKLADRLHNMRTLKYKTEKKQKENSQETLDIYAPIAYKLGIYKLKSELEDLSLKYLNEKIFNDLKKKIVRKRVEREKEVSKITKNVRNLMEKKEINCKVFGRAKHFYSIYKKMASQKKKFDEIYDLLAVRVITASIDDCYRALGVIHSTWTPILAEFSDYIAAPKPNGYQSIHTKIVFDGKPLEIQIRTAEMHHIAEEGIAAHWRYKETEHDKRFDKKIAWLKQILAWKRETKTAREFVESLKIDLFENEIVVLTPKGDPISIPEGSTPVDFAYRLHTEIGNVCERAKANGEIISLDHELKPGDIVEILTSKKAKPSRSWLKFAKTGFARSKIRHALGIKGIQRDDESEDFKLGQRVELIDKKMKEKIRLSKCCSPKFGDEISALLLKDGKISVHKVKCKSLSNTKAVKKIKVWWPEEEKSTTIIINATDRVGMLAQVLNTIAEVGINVQSINANAKKEHTKILIKVQLDDLEKIKEVIKKIKRISNVLDATFER